jgi:hypothetical protein
MKILDWHKIAEYIKQYKPHTVHAGLSEDWRYTCALVWYRGIVETSSYNYYFASDWATPQIRVDYECIDCFITEDDNPAGFNAETWWPQVARDILYEY